jgi:hypothetical protein
VSRVWRTAHSHCEGQQTFLGGASLRAGGIVRHHLFEALYVLMERLPKFLRISSNSGDGGVTTAYWQSSLILLSKALSVRYRTCCIFSATGRGPIPKTRPPQSQQVFDIIHCSAKPVDKVCGRVHTSVHQKRGSPLGGKPNARNHKNPHRA